MGKFTVAVLRKGDEFKIINGDHTYSTHRVEAPTREEAERAVLKAKKVACGTTATKKKDEKYECYGDDYGG